MPDKDNHPPQSLRAARRSLEGMTGVKLLADWMWSEDVERWFLHCQLSPPIPDIKLIQPSSNWYVLADHSYPWGEVDFFPSKQNSITCTFPHQLCNVPGPDSIPWRKGKLCLDTTVHALNRQAFDKEPFDAHLRLRWRFERALCWIEAAAYGKLSQNEDPFELPDFPIANLPTISFCEDQQSFDIWQETQSNVGLAEFGKTLTDVYFAKRFIALNGETVFEPTWGSELTGIQEQVLGIWLRAADTPVLDPWQAPINWGQLREVFEKQGLSLDDLLRPAAANLRDNQSHLCLVGFGIPSRVGRPLLQMHWQALQLPILAAYNRYAKGFRKGEAGYWAHDRQGGFRDRAEIQWLNSENWHQKQLSERGRLPSSLTRQSGLLIGVGALGSAVSELLVRGGLHALTVADGDYFGAGNLVRHILTMDDLQTQKAMAVAQRLNKLSPHSCVKAISSGFPPSGVLERHQTSGANIIIDCTASDEMLHLLEVYDWERERLFISISLGLEARRLFCYAAYSKQFPLSEFRRTITPWLRREIDEHTAEFPREGIGCWHPVFPARVDDVWLMASTAVKYIEGITTTVPNLPTLAVFEQTLDNNRFIGIRQVFGD